MTTSPLAIGDKVGDTWSQYRLDMVEVQTAAATVYRATSLQDRRIAHHPDDTVSNVTFVVVLHHPLEPSAADSPERWQVAKKLMRQAMTLVSPVAAGFPEWNKIREDDPARLDHGELDGIHWGAFQISTYRRRLARATAAGRKPHTFSTAQRTSLLKSAGNECWRCGSTERLEADHIIPISHGGTNEITNGIILCAPCHLQKTQAERTAFGQSLSDAIEKGGFVFREKKEALIPYLRRYFAEVERRTGFELFPPNEDHSAGHRENSTRRITYSVTST